MKAGYVQFAPAYLAVEENIERVRDELSNVDADLMILPELFTSGYFFRSRRDLVEVAEPIPDGPTTGRLQEWSAELGTTIVAGLAERAENGIYNSAVLVRPNGTVDTYRKVHLYYEETTLFTPGNLGFPVFSATTRDGQSYNLGMMVCFDWYFPEAARSLALRGADVIAHPSNLVLPHCPDAMPIRARENHVYTITANRYGLEEKEGETLNFIGMSEICNPQGEILCRAGRTTTAVKITTFDPHEARDREINAYNDVLGDRRPEMYEANAFEPRPARSDR